MDKTPLPFAKLIGLEITEVTPERVTASLKVREDLCTRPAILHGGAIMAFADTVGAYATVANLPAGMTTTTIESSTKPKRCDGPGAEEERILMASPQRMPR